jgi:hypothetical protein
LRDKRLCFLLSGVCLAVGGSKDFVGVTSLLCVCVLVKSWKSKSQKCTAVLHTHRQWGQVALCSLLAGGWSRVLHEVFSSACYQISCSHIPNTAITHTSTLLVGEEKSDTCAFARNFLQVVEGICRKNLSKCFPVVAAACEASQQMHACIEYVLNTSSNVLRVCVVAVLK